MNQRADPTSALGGELYRDLFETAPDGIVVVDAAGRIAIANSRAADLFGYPTEEMPGLGIDQLVPERFRALHSEHRATYALAPHTRPMGGDLALAGLRRDGSEFPIEIALSPVRVAGSTMYVASIRDISELVRTKQAALRGRYSAFVAQFGMEALAQTDFDRLLHAVPPLLTEAMHVDAVLVFRLALDRTEMYCAATLGVPEDKVCNLRVPNDPRYLAGYMVNTRSAVATRDLRLETRFQVPPAIAELGLLAVAGVPLFDRDEVIGGLTVRSREPRTFTEDDINFLQSIANILATALQRSTVEEHLYHAQRLESLGQLTGGVAHDFNNLLMVIVGNLQVLEESLARGSDELELSRAASAAAERGALLTRKLLAFARKQPLHPRLFDLGQLMRDFRGLVQRTLGENIAVRVMLDPQAALLVADPGQLEAALLNLAVNARDAMPGGGQLTLRSERIDIDTGRLGRELELAPGCYVCLAVSDTGSGMPHEVIERAFEPFFTTKEAGKGSGMGLSMVYGFVRQSGGSVRIESAPGHGTTVRLYLPLPPEAQSLDPAPAPPAAPEGAESVLVVEDEAAVRSIAAMFLGKLGYRVHQAADSETALELLGNTDVRIDLLFTDIALPGINGAELAREARRLRPGLAVLFTSGYASASVLDQLPERDTLHLVSKPYRREELALAVRQALDRADGESG